VKRGEYKDDDDEEDVASGEWRGSELGEHSGVTRGRKLVGGSAERR
jgi:hypothetical protein